MKVGSLVELVNDNWKYKPEPDEVYPVKGIVYTIRTMVKGFIRFEEIINKPCLCMDDRGIVGIGEIEFISKRFRELLPPINDVEAYINENTLEPVFTPCH